MHRLIRVLFAFADLFAWLLLVLSVLEALAWPFIGPVYARMAHLPITTLSIVGGCATWVAVAAGAYAITRRRVLGLALVLVPAVVWLVSGLPVLALVFAVVAILVFGTPFLLAFLQARSTPVSGPAG
jgi:hypothetical protein